MFDSQEELLRLSDDEGTLVVSQDDEYRVMRFGTNYNQSALNLENPHALVFEYTQAMLIALAFGTPRHVTMLGLGGGSLLRSLRHHFDAMHFRVIELRQHVLCRERVFHGARGKSGRLPDW